VSNYVDVHTHLTHKAFAGDLPAVIKRAEDAGLGAVVVNGLDPESNRATLEMADTYEVVKAALGLYPVNAANGPLTDGLPYPVPRFDVAGEIAFIREQAQAGRLHAIGECGLDGHWLSEASYPAQEKAFSALIEIAAECDLPLIVHSRKREQRAVDMLAYHGARKVVFHCYGGKLALARKAASEHGWWFSIPANAARNDAFRHLLARLPAEKILTETDAPYLPPKRGERNEPAAVVETIGVFAEERALTHDEAKAKVWSNYRSLFW